MKTVHEVCESTGVTRKRLFYYDRIGLLKPSRRDTNQDLLNDIQDIMDEAAEAEKTAKLADAVKRLDFTEIRGIIG